MRVGVRASVVGVRRIDSVARTAAQVIREASSSGDHRALGRFLRSFTGYLEVPGSAPGPGVAGTSLRGRGIASPVAPGSSTSPVSPSRLPPRSRGGGGLARPLYVRSSRPKPRTYAGPPDSGKRFPKGNRGSWDRWLRSNATQTQLAGRAAETLAAASTHRSVAATLSL
jgi:hypothetical protein